MTPEGKVKAKIKKRFSEEWPSSFQFMPVQTGIGQHGIPDHIMCIPVTITPDMVGQEIGLFVGIEAKTAQGKMSSYQQMQRNRILDAKGIYLTIYGINDIEDKLKLLTDAFK